MKGEILAITTCRVSTPEQLENNSLNRQQEAVIKAAKELGAIIPEDGQWSGSVSSKAGTNTKRKDLLEMLDYCKKHPRVKYLLVHEVDRFMRSVDELFFFEVTFRDEVGVKIIYASQPELNNNDYYSKLLKALEAFKGEGSNVERQKKSIDGQNNALKAGRYPFNPKPGYIRGPEKAIPIVHPERGPSLQRILKRLASGLVSPTMALIELNDSEFTKNHSLYKMDKFEKIATDPFYAGIVEIDKQVKVRNENGLHVPIISIEEHEKLLVAMSRRPKNQIGPKKGGNPKYPLNNLLSDDTCVDEKCNGRIVGFDHSNGKAAGVIYQKYRCRSCKRYWHRSKMHEEVTTLFDRYEMADNVRREVIAALDIVWKQNEVQAEQEIARLNHTIKAIKVAIAKKVEDATDPSNDSIKQEILAAIDTKKKDVEKLEERLDRLTDSKESDKKEFMEFALSFIEDTGQHFLEEYISKENRLRCKQMIFPAGIMINPKNKVYTPEISIIYRLAVKKKDTEVSEKSLMVH